MIPRNEVVLSVLGELQEATESSGLEALTRTAVEVELVLAAFRLPAAPCGHFPEWTDVDDVARGLRPDDAPADLLPLKCKGEGNLLFDAVSMLLVGNTGLSLELQVRTVVEMVLWKRYYLSGMIDSKMMLQAVRFSLCAEESEDMLNLPASVLEAIFDADVKASCFAGSYANMWHVYALSSVLRFNIYSIYPMFNLKIRPYFNRVIRPRTWPQDRQPLTLHVMWSGEMQSESLFRPNHFVALVRSGDLAAAAAGSPAGRPGASPAKSEDSHFSYPSLKDKYNITKRTFYRWKRQTQEHCKKSAARYEAKYFLQSCYLEGKLIPLHQFKEIFPEISRSSYYNWKQELQKSGGNFSTSSSTGEISPGESTEQEAWSSPEAKQQDEVEAHDSVAGMFGLSMGNLDLERAQNVAHMQEAKRCLQSCIAMNTSLPFRVFKRNFPGISRSTYYNWRREALLFKRGYKASAGRGGGSSSAGSGSDSSDADKSQSPTSLSPVQAGADRPPRLGLCRRRHKCFQLAYVSKKQLRDAAKLHLRRSKLSLTKFKLKFPSMSPFFFWLWRSSQKRGKKKKTEKKEEEEEEAVELALHAPSPLVPHSPDPFPSPSPSPFPAIANITIPERRLESLSLLPLEAPKYLAKVSLEPPHSKHAFHGKAATEEQMFAMDVVALANFKAKAKLFLQQRFEEKAFPTFKEFRSYFPFTPRSTYYMWKRALHHGVSLVHG